MSEGIDYGGSSWASIVTAAIAAAAAVTIARCLNTAIARSLYANTTQQVPSDGHQETKEEGWKKPEIGWVKLNVDGSRDHHKRLSAGCGGVLRDASGEWLRGFAKRLDPNTCQADRTELLAILIGMQLARKMKIKRLIVESDHDYAVSKVEDGVKPNKPDYDVVERIRELRFDPIWEVSIVSISNMKANRVADRLANDARKLACEDAYEEYHYPPANCVPLLEEDKLGCVSF